MNSIQADFEVNSYNNFFKFIFNIQVRLSLPLRSKISFDFVVLISFFLWEYLLISICRLMMTYSQITGATLCKCAEQPDEPDRHRWLCILWHYISNLSAVLTDTTMIRWRNTDAVYVFIFEINYVFLVNSNGSRPFRRICNTL